MLPPGSSVEGVVELSGAVCSISYALDTVESTIKRVSDDRFGAIATFIGTTRNSFQGKAVTKLEYQGIKLFASRSPIIQSCITPAYTKLALKTMTQIIVDARNRTPDFRAVVQHRIGVVGVGEPSIVIAVSSPHRNEAFRTCEFILEEVKRKAQIWKREYYEGEDESEAEWKSNV
ncbi:Molybdopterin biosynthesis MoaE [Lentinula boryana]|uniref:Molybdopterin biosynthesis MoaE n=1 Tax=Lentinula boryana TaxID=40481 RepID=A0ABQ8QUZ1_9AGAR|nr:Molybdopterin biosynthesis MoaE [Lentinula boryana]